MTDEIVDVNESLLDKAIAAAQRLEDANAKMESLIKRQEALAIEKTLSGETVASKNELSSDEKEKLAARSLIAGSGFEDLIE